MYDLLYMILIIYIDNRNSHIYAFKGFAVFIQNVSVCRDFTDTSGLSPVSSTAPPIPTRSQTHVVQQGTISSQSDGSLLFSL